MKKYELTAETKTEDGKTLYRIKALKSFNTIKVNDLGGFIESERNLSHEGNCWVYDDACVYDKAFVCDNATIRNNAQVFENAKVSGRAHIYRNAKVSGNAYVADSARVYDQAHIFGDTWISDSAIISGYVSIYGNSGIFDSVRILGHGTIGGETNLYGSIRVDGSTKDPFKIDSNLDIIFLSYIGSEHGSLTAYKTKSGDIYCNRGCFDGPFEEFIKRVNKKDDIDPSKKEYLDFIIPLISYKLK